MSVRPSKKEGFDKFSQCRGNGVALYESGLIACLSDALLFSDMDGFVFSDQPIALESDFIVKILETRHYGPPISFGFTSLPPAEVSKMKSMKEMYLSQKFWFVSWNNICFDGEEHYFQNALKLMHITAGDTVGCRFTMKGEFVININKVNFKTQCTTVPTNCLLWGWVNLDTTVASVISHFQSGFIILRYLGRPYNSSSSANQQYLCMFCKDLPSSVQKAKCCGKICCKECYKNGLTCPSCNLKVDLVTDALLDRKILEIQVFCPNAGKGCSSCISMPLKNVIHHRCKFQGLYQCESLSGDLLEKKQKISLESVRTKLKHISRRKTSCDVHAINSTASDSSGHSLQPMSSSSSLSDVQSQVFLPGTEQMATFDFVVPSVHLKDQGSSTWSSKVFYTHNHGYKISVAINFGSNYFNYISLYMYCGEFDDSLSWPFSATVKCDLLRVDDTIYHASLRYLTPEDGKRVAHNYTRRILLFSLHDENEDYWMPNRFETIYRSCMENDSLKFRLTITDIPTALI